jgi:hypothetical protein
MVMLKLFPRTETHHTGTETYSSDWNRDRVQAGTYIVNSSDWNRDTVYTHNEIQKLQIGTDTRSSDWKRERHTVQNGTEIEFRLGHI